MVVTALTLDGAALNMSMAKILGCELQPSKPLKTWFPHPITSEPVYIFLDICHMLKLFRNTLGDKISFVDGNANLVSWTYIERLHDLQEVERLHLGNKLHKAHIQWRRQKMKIRLAAQVFSDSVADALDVCRKEKMAGFEDSAATAEFILLLNRAFDIFNSRSVHQQYWKAPMQANHFD